MFRQADVWITKIISMLLVLMLVGASFIIFINVILRYIFKSGLNGAFELVTLLIVTITFLGASLLIVDNEHLTMDAAVTILPDFWKRVFEIVVCLIGIVFSTVLLIYAIKVMDTLATGVTPVLQLPSYIPFLPIAIGSFLTIIKFIKRAIVQFKRVEG